MADRSPATRATAAAFDARYELCGPFDDNWQDLCLAAALRAAADQVITENRLAALDTECSAPSRLLLIWARDQLKAIAAELEG